MKLEDYIHLYIGAKCTIHQLGEKPGSTGVIIGVHLDDAFTSNPWVIVRDADRSERSIRLYEIKLILRPLESMTEDECNEWNRLNDTLYTMADGGVTFGSQVMQNAAAVAWALSKGFDLFGLIPASLAIKQES